MKHRGVALITALMVVALATIAATALMSTASLAVHRTESLRDSEAAWWVARGVEAWVLGILKDDAGKNPYDGLDEPWAQPVAALPIDQGVLRGRVVDGQGRFNLNNLLLPAANPHTAQYEQHFRNLLARLGAGVTVPPGLSGAIRDWGDADQAATYPEGAEDGAYLSEDPPYRTADRKFTTVSELLAVRGMTPELYSALSHLVTALPEQDTAINVNTAEPEVLFAMPGANEPSLQNFLRKRREEPLKSQADLTAQNFFGPTAPPSSISTRWFQVQGEVFVGSSRVGLYSLVNRATQAPAVIADSAEIDTVEPPEAANPD